MRNLNNENNDYAGGGDTLEEGSDNRSWDWN